MKPRPLPVGYVCTCGERHTFDAYVAAHWRDVLRHACPKCVKNRLIRSGRVRAGPRVLEPIFEERP